MATEVLKKELKLTVNQRKTHLANLDEGVAFLGFVIYPSYTLIKEGKVEGLNVFLASCVECSVNNDEYKTKESFGL